MILNRPKPAHVRGQHEDKKAPLEHSGFAALGLRSELLRNIEKMGWPLPSPIQAELIPRALNGGDVLGVAQTGTGKTAAFALPTIQQLAELPPAKPLQPYAVVLAPTRELVQQIESQFAALAEGLGVRTATVFGGVADRPQISALNAGVEVVVAAPGRLLDLIGRGWLNFVDVRICVLDEADRMLDMGFIQDIRRILNRMPSRRQMLLLSATLPPEIKKLSAEFLYHAQEVRIGVSGPPRELKHELWEVHADDKPAALDGILRGEYESILVFSRTKHGADKLARRLGREGKGPVGVLHADRSQNQRDRALAQFRSGEVRTLVATDVASRGLDVTGIELVVNYDVPRDAEDYVHRVGRTARAKRSGIAITLLTPEETKYVRKIEQLIGHPIERRRLDGTLIERSAVQTAEEPRGSRSPRGRGRRGEGSPAAPAAPAERGGRGRGRDRADAAPVASESPRRGRAGGGRGREQKYAIQAEAALLTGPLAEVEVTGKRRRRPSDDQPTASENAPRRVARPSRGESTTQPQSAAAGTSSGVAAADSDAPRRRRRRGGRGRGGSSSEG